jgi:hypothetical protein
MTAVNCSACVLDTCWLDPFDGRPGVLDEADELELGAVALLVVPHPSARTETPIVIPTRTLTQDM